MSRKAAREAAMKLMYEYEVTGCLSMDTLYFMPEILKTNSLTEENIEYIQEIIQNFGEHAQEIDDKITQYSISWSISRIAKIDLAILRLAFFEILYTTTPHTILVNEAVDLAKKYSSAKAPSFINGVIGGYLKENLT